MDRQTDGQGQILKLPDYHHGDIKRNFDKRSYMINFGINDWRKSMLSITPCK